MIPSRRIILGVLLLSLTVGYAPSTPAAPGTYVERPGAAPPPCPSSTEPKAPGVVTRASEQAGVTIDECGQPRTRDSGAIPGMGSESRPVLDARALALGSGTNPTIDSMSTNATSYSPYSPSSGLTMLGGAATYYLSDGTSWGSGAGSYYQTAVQFDHVEVVGAVVRYHLTAPPDGVIYNQTDYNSGNHSSQGVLKAAGPLVLEAEIGSTVAEIRGLALVASNDPTWYGEPRFNFFSAPVGAIVPFRVRYTLSYGQTWSETTFNTSFYYYGAGMVEFANPASTPPLVSLEIRGPAEVPDQGTAQYTAWASFEGGALREVSALAAWSVTPSNLATIDAGQLITNKLSTPQEVLTLHAVYTAGGVTRETDLAILCKAGLFDENASEWPMYQANARHTGYVPLTLDPASFGLAWTAVVGAGASLNPVTSAGGSIFATTFTYFGAGPQFFALDARDGHVMWTKSYAAFSVNPPSCGYGNVYVQTGNHGSDTWLRAYSASTGSSVFQAAHSAQWERYYAPTLHKGKVYVNGGYYGGAYSFDALTGQVLWFTGLQQYDEWTPAVDDEFVYVYVGEYSPGLYALRRDDGTLAFSIPDPGFQWNGWSMRLAPVLGDDHDVLAIHGGRLIKFDLASRTIAWQLHRDFTGQPSVAGGVIYAIAGGALLALDEKTQAELWSWSGAGGTLNSNIVVTDSHVFVASATTVHAIDLATHGSVFAYPAGGHLALANDQVYVAGSTGVLTALTARSVEPTLLAEIAIDPHVLNRRSLAPAVTVHVEPIGFAAADIDPGTVLLASAVAPNPKPQTLGDFDEDGVADLTMKFARAALDPLLSPGEVELEVTGSLSTGATFAGIAVIRVIDPGTEPLSVSLAPNPLNPSGLLTIQGGGSGRVSAKLYDIQGRLVRTWVDSAPAPDGVLQFRVDGRGSNGEALASGVYFYRVETGKETRGGRITILK